LWNWHAPGLWNRFVTELVRGLSAHAGLSESAVRELVRVSYLKVAEFQARGLVHFHAMIRLESPADRALSPASRSAPTSCAPRSARPPVAAVFRAMPVTARSSSCASESNWTPGSCAATRTAASSRQSRSRRTWPSTPARAHTTRSPGGHQPEQLRDNGVPEQLVQMAAAAIRLSKRSGLQGIGKWVHMLGFRGHLVTKSRAYSTTLGELRDTRAKWRAAATAARRRRRLHAGPGELAVRRLRLPQPRRRAPGGRRRSLNPRRLRSPAGTAPRPPRGEVWGVCCAYARVYEDAD
jgi:hypothetical protein